MHAYFNPHGSPYDYYIYYMNTLADFEVLLSGEQSAAAPVKKRREAVRS